MDSPATIADASSKTFSRRQTGCVVALLTLLPFVMHSAFYDGGFYYDDQFHLEQCRLIAAQQISVADYVLLPHGEHFIPAWKLLFWTCYSAFGESSVAFHLVVTCFHAAAVVILFLLLKTYTSELTAAAAAVLWAASTIGGWDGPFLWIAASHLSIGVTFFLATMWCIARYRDQHQQRWAFAGSALLTISLFTMGALIVLTPALLLQYCLFEHRPQTSRRQQLTWIGLLTAPCVAVVLIHLFYVLPVVERLDRPPMNPTAALQMLSGGYAVASWKLFVWAGDPLLWGRWLGLFLIGGLLLKATSTERRISVVFFVLSLFFSILAYTARSGWEVEHVLTWGRYRYLPTLFWCVVSGSLIAAALQQLQQRRRDLVPMITVGLILLLQVSQYRTATAAAQVFRRIAAEERLPAEPVSDSKTATSGQRRRSI